MISATMDKVARTSGWTAARTLARGPGWRGSETTTADRRRWGRATTSLRAVLPFASGSGSCSASEWTDAVRLAVAVSLAWGRGSHVETVVPRAASQGKPHAAMLKRTTCERGGPHAVRQFSPRNVCRARTHAVVLGLAPRRARPSAQRDCALRAAHAVRSGSRLRPSAWFAHEGAAQRPTTCMSVCASPAHCGAGTAGRSHRAPLGRARQFHHQVTR